MKPLLFLLLNVLLVNSFIYSQAPTPLLQIDAAAVPGCSGSQCNERHIDLSISDAPNDYFRIQNGTNLDNQFIPAIRGHHESDSRLVLHILASTSPTNDVVSNSPLMFFDSRIIDYSNQDNEDIISQQMPTNRMLFGWGSLGDLKMVMSADGALGIGTTNPSGKLDVMGDIYHNGTLIHSDRRFKKNIRTIENPLALIKKLNGVSYDMKTEEFKTRNFSKSRQLGLIAQEVEKVLPELVKDRNDGYKAVNYDGMIPVLLEGLKQQQEIIEKHEEKTEQLAALIQEQQSEVEELKQLMQNLAPNNKDNIQTIVIENAALGQNIPNPFNHNTTIPYAVPLNSIKAFIHIYGIKGQAIKTIPINTFGKGTIDLQTQGLSNGQYTYTLEVDGRIIDTKQMSLVK